MNQNSLRDDKVWNLILRFSIPSIIAMLVSAIYNIVDRIFIGNFVGEEALASLIVVFPIMMILFALSILTGQGGANLVSISLGEGDKESANKYYTNTVILTFVVCTLAAVLCYIFIDPILHTLGAEGAVLDYSRTYLGIYLCFVPFSTISYALSTVVRSEGFPKLSMISMVVSALTNIVFDYIFIGLMGMGVAGGALATGIGQTIGVVILAKHFMSNKTTLHFRKKYVIPQFNIVKRIVVIGFPSFLSTLGVSVAILALNIALNTYGGVEAVTAMSAINSLFTLIIMPINGIQGGIQPIIGYNHGAKLQGRVKETMFKGLQLACGFSVIAFVIIQSVPHLLLAMFIDPSSSTMNGATIGLRLFMLSLPLLPVSVLSIGYFQATQKSKIAIFLGLLRQFILLVVFVYLLPLQFGLIGVWAAVPVADYIAIVISGIAIYLDFKKESENM